MARVYFTASANPSIFIEITLPIFPVRLPVLVSVLLSILPWQGLADDSVDFVQRILADETQDKEILFTKIVHATSGHRVIPVDPNNPIDVRLVKQIGAALDQVLTKLNAGDDQTEISRINEVSRIVEDAIAAELAAVPGFSCASPRTVSGTSQRSGYPDLRLEDAASGRVVYLDPKLYAHDTEGSSLRTFYFQPRVKTGKITEDAHHLLIGISHDGNTGKWRFLCWSLVDLSHLRVRLKAEFQAANRDIYRKAATLATGGSDPR